MAMIDNHDNDPGQEEKLSAELRLRLKEIEAAAGKDEPFLSGRRLLWWLGALVMLGGMLFLLWFLTQLVK